MEMVTTQPYRFELSLEKSSCKMKHAILILAHKDFDQVRHLIEYFVRDCYVYVHIDKKAAITPEELHSIDSMPQVRAVYRKYKVHWGGFSILKTEMFLLRQVLKDGDCDYVHLISGQDYPIKPLDDFLKFFEEHKGKEFIRYANIPNAQWDHYTFSRFKYFYPYEYINTDSKKAIELSRKFVKWQKKLGIKRRIPDHFDQLFGSTQWFSISKEATEAIVSYTKRYPSFYRRARWTFASEEYYIATLLMNLTPRKNVEATDLRLIRWREENGNCPANLGNEHFHLLAENKLFFFARKFEVKICQELLKNIDEYLLNDNNCLVTQRGTWIYNGFQKYKYHDIFAYSIYKICNSLEITSLLDMGCGAGFYVASLRRYGIPTTGYDANPYTPFLSSLLLPEGDAPCGIADISGTFEYDDPFDMVMCLDVLSHIPLDVVDKCVTNLAHLSNSYILLAEFYNNNDEMTKTMLRHEASFIPFGYHKHKLGTSLLNEKRSKTKIESLLLYKP